MKDALSYRVSDEGEQGFRAAIRSSQKWIDANINGPLRLTFAITLKAVAPDGESVQTILSTDNLPLGEVSAACGTRHHKKCDGANCGCRCHGRNDAEASGDA